MVEPPIVVIAFLMVIEYQSADRLRPSRPQKLGVRTAPPETVVDCSGTRLALPPEQPRLFTFWRVKGLRLVPWPQVPVLNSSLMLGARMSNDQVERSLIS